MLTNFIHDLKWICILLYNITCINYYSQYITREYVTTLCYIYIHFVSYNYMLVLSQLYIYIYIYIYDIIIISKLTEFLFLNNLVFIFSVVEYI